MTEKSSEQGRSVGKIIGELSRAAQVFFQYKFKEYSIGHAQVRTLHFIAHNDGISQVELTEYLKLDKSSVTSQLTTLEKNGYIIRNVSPNDARVRTIHITEKTREILSSLKNVFASWTHTLLTNFSDEEKTDIFILLNKMQENAQTAICEIKLNEEKK
jgi:DNA-binding MarR family transcriptional regulator